MQAAENAVAALGEIWSVGSMIPPVWRGVCEAVAPILLTALWQSVTLAVPLKICLRLVPGISAAQRFRVWAVGFATMVCLPLATLLLRAGGGHASSDAVLVQPATHGLLQLDIRWGGAILLLWAAASIFRTVDLAIHTHRLRKLWKTAIPVSSDERMPMDLKEVCGALGKQSVQLCTTRELDNPSVIGFFSPRILIPDWLFECMTADELEQIVCHEVQHLRRHDDWTNLLQKLCLILFPLNIALLWAERQLCLEREMACDEAVVKATRSPRAYAACLTSLAERGIEHRAEALSLAAWQKRSELTRRVHSILLRKAGLSSVTAFAMLVLVSGGLLLGSWELSRCPQLVAFVSARERQAVALNTPESSVAIHPENISATRELPRASAGNNALRAVAARAVVHPHSKSASPATNAAHLNVHPEMDPETAPAGSFQAVEAVLSRAQWPVLESRPEIVSVVQQQWVVWTAWEQVNPATQRGTDATAQIDDGSASQVQSSDNAQHHPQAGSRKTITRVIVRILPANLTFDQPYLQRVSNGWLVFQL